MSAIQDWPTLVTAFAALLGALFSGAAVVAEGRRTRRQLGIQNMWRLIDRWESERIVAAREATARFMTVNWHRREDLPESAFEVLDTFELLGYLVMRSKTLSLEDAWINFPAAIQWWHVFKPGIEQFQEDDATIYEDYARLAQRLIEEEARRRHLALHELTPSEEDLLLFLRRG